MSVQGYWADQKAPVFRDLPDDLVVVLPVGAIEQHGPHLPVCVDRDLVDAVVQRALRLLTSQQNILVLPTLEIAKSGEHDRHPGTLSLSAETFMATLREIGTSVARAGVRRLVFLNGHGGNTAVLDIVARDLRMAQDMIVATSSWFGFADFDGIMDREALAHDIHAGETETSAMLAVRPDLVDMQKAQNCVSNTKLWEKSFDYIGLNGKAARPSWIIDDLSDFGVCGDASVATAGKGEHLLNSAAQAFAAFLSEFAQFDHRR
jgi:creatinine amidohydrolase